MRFLITMIIAMTLSSCETTKSETSKKKEEPVPKEHIMSCVQLRWKLIRCENSEVICYWTTGMQCKFKYKAVRKPND